VAVVPNPSGVEGDDPKVTWAIIFQTLAAILGATGVSQIIVAITGRRKRKLEVAEVIEEISAKQLTRMEATIATQYAEMQTLRDGMSQMPPLRARVRELELEVLAIQPLRARVRELEMEKDDLQARVRTLEKDLHERDEELAKLKGQAA
jgi:DNA repair exonuclease SbcCD ATPase subunit